MMMQWKTVRQSVIAALAVTFCLTAGAAPPPVAAPAPAPVSYGVEEDVFHPVRAEHGMVASVDAAATQVGVDVLKQGGNAVDAAVAVGFALAVTHPQAGNLGGGGFMMLRTKDGKVTAIDFREMAPEKATRDMFLDAQGNADSKKSLTSHLASGTPGSVAGFALALQKYGTMPLDKVIQPAIALARDGFTVNDALAIDLKTYGVETLPNHPASKAIFWKQDGNPYQKGDKLVQANLARSLELIAKDGPDAFYKGPIADQIADEMAKNGGLITKADLANYKAVERTPVSGDYRGYQVYSMPPPSSGGIHIVQILNILENFDLHKYGFGSADAMQIMAEAEKYAYADRSDDSGLTWTRSTPVLIQGLRSDGTRTVQQSDVAVSEQSFHGRGVIQPTLWESSPGTVHMLLRSTEGSIYRSDSTDGGVSWCPPYDTGLPNNNSGIDLDRLPNGWLVLACNPVADNWGARTPMSLLVSRDNGVSWDKLLDLDSGKGEFAYPAVVASGPQLHVTYTWKRENIAYWQILLGDAALPVGATMKKGV